MKETTHNDYRQSIYRTVFYIERHADEELTLEILAAAAGFSKFHFHRIFRAIIGEGPGEFIRRVRLGRTTMKFRNDTSITRIAHKSGYETSASFAKAFKKHFGITPREFSRNVRQSKGETMTPLSYTAIEPFDVLFVRRTGPYATSCGEAWEVLMKFVYEQQTRYKKEILSEETWAIGIGHDNPNITDPDKLRCDACLSCNDKSIEPSGEIGLKTVAGGLYAVFEHRGPYTNLKATYESIGDWIVQSGTALRDEPMFERYLNRDPLRTKPENLRTHIYVPVGFEFQPGRGLC